MAPKTPDRRAGPAREEEHIVFDDRGSHPGILGTLYRLGTDLFAEDGSGIFNLRSGAGLTATEHRDLNTLIHNLARDGYQEIVRTGGKVSSVTVWEDNTKQKKIRELVVTRSAGQVTEIVVRQYDAGGNTITGETLTGTITRTSGRVTSIGWVAT